MRLNKQFIKELRKMTLSCLICLIMTNIRCFQYQELWWWEYFVSMIQFLTHKQLGMYWCLLKLKQWAISSHSADKIFLVLDHLCTMILHLQWIPLWNKITFWKKDSHHLRVKNAITLHQFVFCVTDNNILVIVPLHLFALCLIHVIAGLVLLYSGSSCWLIRVSHADCPVPTATGIFREIKSSWLISELNSFMLVYLMYMIWCSHAKDLKLSSRFMYWNTSSVPVGFGYGTHCGLVSLCGDRKLGQ